MDSFQDEGKHTLTLRVAFRAVVGTLRSALLSTCYMQCGVKDVVRRCEGADEEYRGGGEGSGD